MEERKEVYEQVFKIKSNRKISQQNIKYGLERALWWDSRFKVKVEELECKS